MMPKKYFVIACALLAGAAAWLVFTGSPGLQSALRHTGMVELPSAAVSARKAQGTASKLPLPPGESANKLPNTVATTSGRPLVRQGMPTDPAQSIYGYQEAAEQGEPEAQLQLGLLYEQGTGVERDPEEALRWFTLAAEQGNAAAQANLGDLFEFGDGIKSNKAAAYYYRQAATQGYRDAQLDLGRLYELGKGLPQDPVQAYRWYDLAAQQGDATAAQARERVSIGMSPAQIAEARKPN
jgi:TPR repeat protein